MVVCVGRPGLAHRASREMEVPTWSGPRLVTRGAVPDGSMTPLGGGVPGIVVGIRSIGRLVHQARRRAVDWASAVFLEASDPEALRLVSAAKSANAGHKAYGAFWVQHLTNGTTGAL